VGTGVPAIIAGDEEGDMYLDDATGDVYQVVGGVWVLQDNITGPQGPPGADADQNTLAAVFARRTTLLASIGDSTWRALPMDVTDTETDTTVLEHNNTITSRIDVKADGYYWAGFNVSSQEDNRIRITLNGTPLAGMGRPFGETTDPPGEDYNWVNTNSLVVQASAGDYFEIEEMADTGTEDIQPDARFWVISLEGSVGPQGPTGPAGPASPGALLIAQVYNTNTATNVNTASFTDIPLNGGTDFLDTGYVVSGTGIEVPTTTRYKVTAHVYVNGDKDPGFDIGVSVNGAAPTFWATSTRTNHDADGRSVEMSYWLDLTDGDVVTVQGRRAQGELKTDAINLDHVHSSWLTLEHIAP
jgi:hypothetical protein